MYVTCGHLLMLMPIPYMMSTNFVVFSRVYHESNTLDECRPLLLYILRTYTSILVGVEGGMYMHVVR